MSNRRAWLVIAIATTLDVIGGLFFALVEHLSVGMGLYWSVTTTTTVGYGDISPHTVIGHYITVMMMITVIPLVASAFSLMTSGLTTKHVSKESDRTRQRLDHIIKHHPEIPDFEESSE